jgi:mRNA interferase MazF
VDVVNRARRDEVWLVALDPSQGADIQKTRPCLVVSPDEANAYLRTVIVAPITTTERSYPTRDRLLRKLGAAPAKTAQAVSSVLVEMFTRA